MSLIPVASSQPFVAQTAGLTEEEANDRDKFEAIRASAEAGAQAHAWKQIRFLVSPFACIVLATLQLFVGPPHPETTTMHHNLWWGSGVCCFIFVFLALYAHRQGEFADRFRQLCDLLVPLSFLLLAWL